MVNSLKYCKRNCIKETRGKDITFLKILAEIATLLEKLLKMSLAVEDSIHGRVVAHLPFTDQFLNHEYFIYFLPVEYHLSRIQIKPKQ